MTERTHFKVEPASAPITDAISKVGGQPVWLQQPEWPISRDHGRPMWFIAQFAIPNGLAYLFLTDATEPVDYAAEPEGGENAVIIQPDGRIPMLQRSMREEPRPIHVARSRTGPTIASDHAVISIAGAPADSYQFIGGEPEWLQAPDPPDEGYRLIAQLDSEKLPFYVNFGDCGTAYAFLSPDGKEGRFLWQN